MRYAHEVHAHEVHAREIYAHEIHAYEIYTHEKVFGLGLLGFRAKLIIPHRTPCGPTIHIFLLARVTIRMPVSRFQFVSTTTSGNCRQIEIRLATIQPWLAETSKCICHRGGGQD